MHCIIKYFIYFEEKSNVKLIAETQELLTPGKKTKKFFGFQRKRLKTAILGNLETTTWNIPELL